MTKHYLGDGAYAEDDGFALVLTAEDGTGATDTVVLEPQVMEKLLLALPTRWLNGALMVLRSRKVAEEMGE